MRQHCENKDTMGLKTICSLISVNTKALDVIMQFVPPTTLLQPLCQLLDAWRYDDDQGRYVPTAKVQQLTVTGEYQPVYEEFSAIFLLVMVFVARFDLSDTDLGIAPDSFIAKYLEIGSKPKNAESLTEEEKTQMSVWIKGLWNPDSMADEVLSCCRPQEFYLLAATIFQNYFFAAFGQAFPSDGLRLPLECKNEPFTSPRRAPNHPRSLRTIPCAFHDRRHRLDALPPVEMPRHRPTPHAPGHLG